MKKEWKEGKAIGKLCRIIEYQVCGKYQKNVIVSTFM